MDFWEFFSGGAETLPEKALSLLAAFVLVPWVVTRMVRSAWYSGRRRDNGKRRKE